MSEMAKRLYQPNLMCSFDITLTDDHNLWTLIVENHEDIGITDNQFVVSLWNFASDYINRLKQLKRLEIGKDEKLPEVQAIISHNVRYTKFNVILQTEDKPLNQTSFALVIANLAKNLAEEWKIDLTSNNLGASHANA